MPKGQYVGSYELKSPPPVLVFGEKPPRTGGASSPYRRAIEELMSGSHGSACARFKDTSGARTALKKWAEHFGVELEYARDTDSFLWIRVNNGKKREPEQANDFTAAVLQAIRETPRTAAEISTRVTKQLWTVATPIEVSKELQRLISAGTVRKNDDLKHFIIGKQRG